MKANEDIRRNTSAILTTKKTKLTIKKTQINNKEDQTMRKYLYSENGFVEKSGWEPNCWVNVECPDDSDFQFLTQELKVPETFLEDIADTDERPRTETEGDWLLTILRIPMQSSGHGIPFITVPIGIITNNDIIVSVCYHHTELIPDFVSIPAAKASPSATS